MKTEKKTLFGIESPVPVSAHQEHLFELYLEDLLEWNKKINITAITRREDIIVKHFIDSLLALQFTTCKGRIADIGSGGGFPGIPVKIIAPGINTVLMESNRKKANFLKHIIRKLGLKNIDVYNGRAETWKENNYFDCALSRAFSDTETCCRISVPLVKPAGQIIVMKGAAGGDDLDEEKQRALGVVFHKKKGFRLPRKKGARSILLFQKCFT